MTRSPQVARTVADRPARRRTVAPAIPTLIVLAVAVVAVGLYCAGQGQVHIPYDEVLGSVAHHLGLEIGPLPTHPRGEETLWVVRFPRVILAALVGAALGCAGVLMQGVLANPLAEPGVVGVSAGAAVGASAAFVAGGIFASGLPLVAAGFLGGVVTAAGVYLLAVKDGRAAVVTIVLTGIAVNAFAGGVIALMTFIASPTARDQIVFWQLGSLNAASWEAVWIVGAIVLLGVPAALVLARRLDLLALGEAQAAGLGIDVDRLRRTAMVLVAVLVAGAVSFTGIVMFVGLVVPHLLRMIVGPAHRVLVPASALGGALILLISDLVARTLVGGADLPLGMVTALVGAPVFFVLLRKRAHGW